mmetsp:Transcript_39110/g.103631  ORF Transcript_39110/g.103631 Transcript_39110/m.103631 type:complete len:211 (+) Transcript_39110:491-1123(+)
MCALRWSRVQNESLVTEAPIMIEESSISDQIWHASSGSSSAKACLKAAACGSQAVASEASDTSATYSPTLSAVSRMPDPPALSSTCGWPGNVKSTQSPSRSAALIDGRPLIWLNSAGSTSRRELSDRGPWPRIRRQKSGCSCMSTRRLSRMHFATTWPSRRKRSRICCASLSCPSRNHAGCHGSGYIIPIGTPSRNSRGSEVRSISATCA